MSKEILDPELLFGVTKIELFKDEEYKGAATGFFYNVNDENYLITNNHVVKAGEANILRFIVHCDKDNLLEARQAQVDLFKDNIPVWYGEYHSDQGIDIAALKITDALEKNDTIYWFSSNYLPCYDEDFPNLLSDIFIIGYPRGIHDENSFHPLLLSSKLSTRYQPTTFYRKFFHLDRSLYAGLSGSPVLFNTLAGECKLLGICASMQGNLYSYGDAPGRAFYSHYIETVISDDYVLIEGNPRQLIPRKQITSKDS